MTVAVDDCGTGFSPLAYLRDATVDELKLDRRFVASSRPLDGGAMTDWLDERTRLAA